MAADFNKPVITDSYIENYGNIRDNEKAIALMFNGINVTNIPVGAIQYASGVFNKWGGASWSPELVSVSGGGTGSSTAAGARTALDIYSKGEGDTRYLLKTNNLSGLTDPALARVNLGANDAGNLTIGTVETARLPVSSTSSAGIVQLNNTVISASTSQAGTANSVKQAYDRAGNTQVLYQSTGAPDIRFARFTGGANFGTISIVFIDVELGFSTGFVGTIQNFMPSTTTAISYSSLFIKNVSGTMYEYRIELSYDTYPTKKVRIGRLNLSTGFLNYSALYIASIHITGDSATLVEAAE